MPRYLSDSGSEGADGFVSPAAFHSFFHKSSRCISNGCFQFAGPVSRVLFRSRSPGLCHLSTTTVARRLQQPTPRHRASNPRLSVYMVLQPAGRTAGRHRCPRGGLLPRLFTLTRRPKPAGRSFSVTLPYPHEYQVVSLRGALRCPDFPPPVSRRRQSGPAAAKVVKNSQFRIHNSQLSVIQKFESEFKVCDRIIVNCAF